VPDALRRADAPDRPLSIRELRILDAACDAALEEEARGSFDYLHNMRKPKSKVESRSIDK
jgi:hypothetical protein